MNRIKLVLVMVIWGSLGVFTRSIPLSALSLAFLRALIALPVLFAVLKMKKTEKVEWRLLKPYIISGSLLGFGWLTLFYGYKHTSISSAVIIYNMCPVYVMIAAPLLLKETISKIQIAVVFFSFLGLFMIVGQNLSEGYGYLGMALSAVSGMLYATIILINRSIRSRVDNQTGTFVQISAAMIVLLPFVLAEGNILTVRDLDAAAVIYTILLGVLHTGIVYTIFFSLTTQMKYLEIVLYSYLEPLFGILFSVIFIGEKLTVLQIIGGILILGSTYIGEILKDKKKPALPSPMQT
ncbi:MAG: EamA family transporter [Synergistetes bacterium HGW-Synergistetes-1]|nr:MAG: EamA family transporter [Synergistetes bacterium HGW-Synergistetes-1]